MYTSSPGVAKQVIAVVYRVTPLRDSRHTKMHRRTDEYNNKVVK